MEAVSVLITGGAGRLGSRLVDELLARGQKVHVLDVSSVAIPGGATSVVFDVREPGAIDEFVRVKPDVVVHLAACTAEAASHTFPEEDAAQNVLGALAALHAAHVCGARRFVFASSDAACARRSPYGVAKYAGERYCGSYHAMYGLPYAAVRIPEAVDETRALRALVDATLGEAVGIIDVV